jgi:hypothetical protein
LGQFPEALEIPAVVVKLGPEASTAADTGGEEHEGVRGDSDGEYAQ